jgi:hypothetical protein
MTQQFFEIERGLLLNGATFLSGAGAPSGSGDSSVVGIGSQWLDTSSGEMYIKKVAGAGAANWTRMALSTEMATGISWREPAKVANLVATTVPTGTAGNPVTVDGVSITNGERVLFTAISGGSGPNVYIYDQALGTFYEDTNLETAGDNVFVAAGTSAGKTFNYNGTAWVLANQSNLDEEGFIRAYDGKPTAGNVLPTYSTQNYITNGDSLTTAAGKLDAQAKANADAIAAETSARAGADSALQSELNTTQTGAGLNADGTYTAFGAANYISTATSLKGADNALDAQLKAVSDDVAALELSNASQTTLLNAAHFESFSPSNTGASVLDGVTVDSAAAVKWIVHAQGTQVGDEANKVVVEILATHNGTSAADATAADFNVFAKLKMGTITGLSFSVGLTGAGAVQEIQLWSASTMECDIRAVREIIPF